MGHDSLKSFPFWYSEAWQQISRARGWAITSSMSRAKQKGEPEVGGLQTLIQTTTVARDDLVRQSSWLYLSRAEITGLYYHAWFYVLGIWTPILLPLQQALKPLSHLDSLGFLFLKLPNCLDRVALHLKCFDDTISSLTLVDFWILPKILFALICLCKFSWV